MSLIAIIFTELTCKESAHARVRESTRDKERERLRKREQDWERENERARERKRDNERERASQNLNGGFHVLFCLFKVFVKGVDLIIGLRLKMQDSSVGEDLKLSLPAIHKI